jgi:hypothetical protein
MVDRTASKIIEHVGYFDIDMRMKWGYHYPKMENLQWEN